jgi:hypothetical protein
MEEKSPKSSIFEVVSLFLSGFREYVSNYTCQMEAMRFKLLEKKKGNILFELLLLFKLP